MDKYDALRLDSQLCFPLYAVSREIIKRYTPSLDALGLTYTQYITMMVMWEKRELLVKELGAKLFLDCGTLTPVLSALEKKGWIEKKRSQADRRDVVVTITESGMELREQAVHIPEKVGACVPLSGEDAMQLYRILHELMDKMR